jgi:zinc transport system ATP-binding protein
LILNALISRPELVLMDEPTASIDETGQEKFYNILKNIVKENKNVSFVIVSHNREKVFTYSDKILHLHKSCSCINYPDKILDKDSELSHYNHIHDHKHID